jgi:hypothetical protein
MLQGFDINRKYLMLVCAFYHNMTKFQLQPSTIRHFLFGLTVLYDKNQWLKYASFHFGVTKIHYISFEVHVSRSSESCHTRCITPRLIVIYVC